MEDKATLHNRLFQRSLLLALWWIGKNFGYIKPDAPVNHEAEAQREGKVWIGRKNLAPGLDELIVGMKVSFKVYSDTDGLGASECSIV